MIPSYQVILFYSLNYHSNTQVLQMTSMLQPHFMISMNLYNVNRQGFCKQKLVLAK